MNGAQRTIPNSVTGECRGPLRSNPAIPTRGVSNLNQFRTKYKQVAEFTSPGGICLWHHWWTQPGSPTLKVSQHRSEKGSSTVKGKILSWKQGHSKVTGSKENPCISLLPPSSPLTQILSLCTQKPTSTSFSALRAHHAVHLASLPYLPQVPPSHHFHYRHLRLSQKSREGTL